MANGFTIGLEGLDGVLKGIKTKSKDIQDEVDNELMASTQEMATLSKRYAPVDVGFLRNNISASNKSYLNKEFVSAAEYSAYVEFGTKTYVRVPSGLEAYASQFRGGKGTKGKLLDNIRKWLKRVSGLSGKQLESKARYISYIIATKGIKPQPFFFRAYEDIKPKLIQRIKNIVDEKR